MREKVFEFANKARKAAASSVGLSIMGGLATSVGTYALGYTNREIDLKETKRQLDEERDRNKLLTDKAEMNNGRNQALLFALREADKSANSCQLDKALLRYALDNSFCLFKKKLGRDIVVPF